MLTKPIAALFTLLSLAFTATAHFHIEYPEPRGVFVSENEPNFCDGYTDAASNRSTFPLHGGYITLTQSHTKFTAGVLISIEQNPDDFGDFNTSSTGIQLPYAVPFFQGEGAGEYCIPVDIGNLNITGVGNGTNVTLQVMFSGSDGNLFQCADLTLSENFTIPTDVNCTNVVGNGTSTATGSSSTESSAADRTFVSLTGLAGMAFAVILGI